MNRPGVMTIEQMLAGLFRSCPRCSQDRCPCHRECRNHGCPDFVQATDEDGCIPDYEAECMRPVSQL